jgi:hypothetical protein
MGPVSNLTKRARIVALMAIGAIVAVLFLRHRPKPHAPVASEAESNGRPELPRRGSDAVAAPPQRQAAQGQAVTYSFGRPNPIIERVRVDKTEVCAGEENMALVDVTTVDGTEADIKITLTGAGFVGVGATGDHLPFRLFKELPEEAMPTVVVMGAGGTRAEARVPFVKVKDCQPEPFVEITIRRAGDRGPDVFDFEVVAHPAEPLASVTWTFGDGQTMTTTEPRLSHDFGQRRQNSRFSEFLVTATARTERAGSLTGSKTLELVNRDYIKLRPQAALAY